MSPLGGAGIKDSLTDRQICGLYGRMRGARSCLSGSARVSSQPLRMCVRTIPTSAMICLFPFPFLVMYTANLWRLVSEGQRLDSFSKRNLHEGHVFYSRLSFAPRNTRAQAQP